MRLDKPKQYLEVCGRFVIEYSLSTFAENVHVDVIQFVAEDNWRDVIGECLDRTDLDHIYKGISIVLTMM